ncbi:hypothetical protein MATL_G00072420 [Megalops atlanticus]|uniref:Coiled-coil domain-containing protein n=1 Tax=Megalops atlanticus TaxID=7932 RepID=A0A9D3T910_MEGAT|nr:hypothetical protein MATL_G00072420 [Megalops atlanticus]
MTELDIDQSHLPRVQEVCQCFAVLEDGALAHNLQEQEIEQYYNSNVQKNQLVQNDIRIARRLQDEEDQQARLSQASRQLEEQDSEYARMIQEEIERRAEEEARRREEEDEEMAKRLQEEEEMEIRRQRPDSGCHGDTSDTLTEEYAGVPAPPYSPRPAHTSTSLSPSPSPSSRSSEGEWETCQPPTSRGRSSVSDTDSDCAEPPPEPRNHAPPNNMAPRQADRQSDALRLIRNLLRESLGPSYCFDDEVFLRPPSMPAHRLQKRLNTAPSTHQVLDYHAQGNGNHSFHGNVRAGERERDSREERVMGSGRSNRSRDERFRSNSYHGDLRWEEGGAEDYRGSAGDRVHRWSYREEGGPRERHVHFQDQGRRYNSYHGDSRRQAATGSHDNFGDRGVAARRSCRGDFRQVTGGSRGYHDDYRSGEDRGHHHGQFLQRNVCARRSYHGDFRDRRRDSNRADRRGYDEGSSQSGHRVSYRENPTIQEDRVYQRGGYRDDRGHGDGREWEGRGHRSRWGREEEEAGGAGGRHHGEHRVRRSVSERWRGHEEEPGWEEEGGLREERRRREGVRRCVSFSSRTAPPGGGHRGAGAALRRDGGCLELGELEQVLRDEELARRLQEEEERLLRKSPRSSSGPRNLDSREDFRAAQVAQDEEIARFMQRRERRAQRQSCDMEGQGSRWDHRDPGDAHERRSARERRVELPRTPRERLDSEGLNSPGEDLSPDCQTPSPNCTSPNSQAVRNIAEELDPTFKPSRRESNPSQTSGLSTSPSSHSGLHDYTQEPTFVPPTKRQSDKSVRPKSKEKKESCIYRSSVRRCGLQRTSPWVLPRSPGISTLKAYALCAQAVVSDVADRVSQLNELMLKCPAATYESRG